MLMGSIAHLSDNEAKVYQALVKAADKGAPCPKHDELNEIIGCSSTSASPTIVARLERYGLIRVDRYQRERQVTIVRTGKATAEPRTKAPHWRDRPKQIPAPAPDSIRTKKPDTFSQIVTAATQERRAIADFLADLVWIGWDQYQAEKEAL